MDVKIIEAAALKWAIDNKRKFPHLTIPEFVAGAKWALMQIEPVCNGAASLIEDLQAENSKLLEMLGIARQASPSKLPGGNSCTNQTNKP